MTDPHSKRQHERVPLSVEVTLESEHNFYTGITDNISEGGLFVAMDDPPQIGSEVAFELVLGEQRFQLTGVVCWVRSHRNAGPDQPEGCGLRWTHLPAAAAQAIQRFVRGRETLFYEE
jgi:uncharacterized protein (TIGR02266 family)